MLFQFDYENCISIALLRCLAISRRTHTQSTRPELWPNCPNIEWLAVSVSSGAESADNIFENSGEWVKEWNIW